MKNLKIFLIFLILLLILSVRLSFADNIVASVNGEPITWLQMQNRYEILWKDYLRDRTKYPSVSQETFEEDLKRIALDQLIKEKLYQIYADEHNITITGQELEVIFREIYSDNERFLSNSEFDEQKFLEFKNQHPQTYQQIINKIRDDILDEKVEQVIKQQFQISDQQLFEIYFNENSRIKLKYIIVPDSLMPDMFPAPPAYLEEFYQRNRGNYMNPKKVKIKFFVIEDRYFFSQENSEKAAHNLAKTTAEKLIKRLKRGIKNERTLRKRYHIFVPFHYGGFETDYLQYGDRIGKLKNSENIVRFALQQKEGKCFAYPIEQDEGWLIFQTVDIQDSDFADFSEAAPQCWNDYIKYGRETYFDNESENYYKENIENQDIFKVNISYILFNKKELIFDINISSDSVASYYEKNIEDFITVRDTLPLEKVQQDILEILVKEKEKILTDSLISAVCEKVRDDDFDIQIPNSRLVRNVEFIKNIPYYELPFPLLADTIFTTPQDSLFMMCKNKNVLIGKVIQRKCLKRSELPQLKRVIENLMQEKWDRDWQARFQKYYQTNKNKYFTEDRFKFQYLLLPIDTSWVQVPEKDAIVYYYKNLKKYVVPKKIKLETIFLKKSQSLNIHLDDILSALDDLVSFSLLSKIYFTPDWLTEQNYNFIDFDSVLAVQEGIKSAIDTLQVGEISSPIYTANGCYIIKLLAKEESIIPDFQEVKADVLYDIKHQQADSLAHTKIAAIFGSVNSVTDSLLQQNDSLLYETGYISLNELAEYFGDPFHLIKDDVDLFKKAEIGSKIPKLFLTKKGYAILFLKDKIPGKKITGYDSYVLAGMEFSQIKRYEASRNFVDYLAHLVKNNDESLIPILGGFYKTDWLKFSDLIDSLETSPIILRDAFSHDIGAYSHSIRFSDDGFGFYYVIDKKVVTPEEFLAVKDKFREEYSNSKLGEWFKNYKIEKKVKIFGD
jgi:hypothetical protein